MSRFRVWCKNKNEWEKDEWEKDEVFLRPDGTLVHLARMGGFFPLKPETHILVRSTGLKDKNGKEIFEGDIIRIGGCFSLVVNWQEETCRWWLSGKCDGKNIEMPLGRYMRKRYEVIGNTYENLELLGVTKVEPGGGEK